jgi:hypothetical protein
MERSRPFKRRAPNRTIIRSERLKNNARRERRIVDDAIRMRAFSPAQRVDMLIDLSNICVELRRGRKDG